MEAQCLYANLIAITSHLIPPSIPHNNIGLKELYSRYAIRKLLHTLSNPEVNTAELESLFTAYHAVVRHTQLVAPHDPHSLLTQTYLALANLLEDTLHKSRFQILIPSLNIVEYEASSTSLNDQSLEITDFVISDDETSIIEVLETLDFASEDGVLKHTRLFNGEMKRLTDTEAGRVTHHSPEAEDYWEAIQYKMNIELNGESFGATLKRLAKNLLKGGVKAAQDGQELNSGEAANVGILEFFQWFNELHQEEREIITSCKAPGLTDSMQKLLGHLDRPQEANFREIRYCVEIISGNILTILEHNQKLFNLYPKNNQKNKENSIEYAKNKFTAAREKLVSAMKNPKYRVTAHYPDAGNRFIHAFANIKDLHPFVAEEMNLFFSDLTTVKKIIATLKPECRLPFLRHLGPSLNCTKNPELYDIVDIILSLATDERAEGIQLLSTSIFNQISTYSNFKKFIDEFELMQTPTILQTLYSINPSFFNTNIQIYAYLLNQMSPRQLPATIDLLANDLRVFFVNNNIKSLTIAINEPINFQLKSILENKLFNLFRNIDAFKEFLLSLPDKDWPVIFNSLSDARSKNIFFEPSIENLHELYQSIPEDKKLVFLRCANPLFSFNDIDANNNGSMKLKIKLFEQVAINRNSLFYKTDVNKQNCAGKTAKSFRKAH